MNTKNRCFLIKDCTLATIATGVKAQSLTELRDRIAIIPQSSIYYHFWGGRLRTQFEYLSYHNDFSYWAHHCLHDDVLAERLELINPTEFSDMNDLRAELIGVIENRLDEKEITPMAKHEEQFHFVRSTIVIFSTQYKVKDPSEFVHILPVLTRSSIFYHYIDAARRIPDKTDDFSTWLQGLGPQYDDLILKIRKIDPYFISSADLQTRLINIFIEHFVGK